MGSVIIFIIIAYLIKKGMTSGVGLSGFSDLGKIFGTVCLIFFIVSLFAHPLIWILIFLALVALIIWLVQKYSSDKRTKEYGWDTEEYQEKYAECLKKFKESFDEMSAKSGMFDHMNETQKRALKLANEKRAEAKAKEEAEAYMREKYGDRTVDAEETETGHFSSKADHETGKKSSSKQKEPKIRAAQPLKSKILPRNVAKRKKIVQSFSDKYDLYLTEEQVKRIADASYMSPAWKNEVEAMSLKYDAVYGWLIGDTAYLRAYLHAFTVQDVTSDFKQQMQIVMDSFETVFEYSDTYDGLTIDQRIEKINSHFMTNFDEITYMIAYRYLESLGLHHKLDKTELNKNDSAFDDLMHKYDEMSTDEVDEDLSKVNTGQTAN